MSATKTFLMIGLGIIISIGLFTAVGNNINDATTDDIATVSVTYPGIAIPSNVTLTEDDIVGITSVGNGTVNLDASNYTLFAAAQRLQINDNSTDLGSGPLTATYTHRGDGTVTGSAATLIGLILLFLALIAVIYVLRGNGLM